MKSILVFIVLVALSLKAEAEPETVPVYNGPQGYQLLDSKITLTPFSVEKGIQVTDDELDSIISGKKLFVDNKEEKHWVNPYTLSISSTSTEHIVLVGTTVRKVKETVVLKEELFNLFYLFGIMYIAFMCTIPAIPFVVREQDNERICAYFICITVIMAICSLVSHDIIPYMFKSFGGALAANVLGFVASLAALSQLIGKYMWQQSIVGIIAMVMMMVIVYF